MNVKEMGISKRQALMMFWNEGFDSEEKILKAHERLMSIPQPTKDYWYASDVSKAIKQMKGKA